MRRPVCFLAILTTLLLATGAPAAADSADERRITLFDIEVTLHRDGSVDMVETITYDLGATPRFGMIRVIPRSGQIGGYGFRDFGLSDVQAESLDAGLPVSVVRRGHEVEVQVGDPNGPATLTGEHRFRFSYTYRRMVVPVDDGVLYHADLVGTGWTVPIEQTRVRIQLPQEAVTGDGAPPRVQCYAGNVGSQDRCRSATGYTTASGEVNNRRVRFGHSRLEPGQALTVRLDFPTPTAMSADPTQYGEGPTAEDSSSDKLSWLDWLKTIGVVVAVIVVGALLGGRSSGSGRHLHYSGGAGGGGGGGGGGAGAGGGGGGGG
ncbi:MAG TPA: DUF2207 domain-containing protein [Natronosporangium sp.]|jgi:uncharacterized membrane protein YgcG|nr:DUF2207 domain-containing protein [Natronosporangium sp.]